MCVCFLLFLFFSIFFLYTSFPFEKICRLICEISHCQTKNYFSLASKCWKVYAAIRVCWLETNTEHTLNLYDWIHFTRYPSLTIQAHRIEYRGLRKVYPRYNRKFAIINNPKIIWQSWRDVRPRSVIGYHWWNVQIRV